MSTIEDLETLTTPQVARLCRVNTAKALRWIASGELRAINIAFNLDGLRPRWRILEVDLRAFLASRANLTSTKPTIVPEPVEAALAPRS